MDPELLAAVQRALADGMPRDSVVSILRKNGYTDADAIVQAAQPQVAAAPPVRPRVPVAGVGMTPMPVAPQRNVEQALVGVGQGLTLNKLDNLLNAVGAEKAGAEINRIDEETPTVSRIGGRMAGATPWAMLTAGLVNPITSTPAAMLAASGISGVEGIVSGLGEPGGPWLPGLLGAIGGPAVATGARGLAPRQTPKQRAAQELQRVVGQSQRGATGLLDDMVEGQRLSPMLLADSPELTPLAAGATAAGGAEAKAAATRILQPRVDASQARTMAAVQDLAGGNLTPAVVARDLVEDANKAINRFNYGLVENTPIPASVRERVAPLMRTAEFRDAYRAVREAEARTRPTPLLSPGPDVGRVPPGGGWEVDPDMDFRTLQQVYRRLRQAAGRDPQYPAPDGQVAHTIDRNVFQPLHDAMTDPEKGIKLFSRAQREAAQGKEVIEMAEAGTRFMQANPDEVAYLIRQHANNPRAIEAYKNNALDALFNVPRGQARGRNAATRFDTEAFDEKLAHVFGAEDPRVLRFLRTLDNEADMRASANAILRGSQTEDKAVIVRNLNQPDIKENSVWNTIRAVATGWLRGGKESGTAAGIGAESAEYQRRLIAGGLRRGQEAGRILTDAMLEPSGQQFRGLLDPKLLDIQRANRTWPYAGLLGTQEFLPGLFGQ